MTRKTNRLDELNGRTSALSLVISRVQRLAAQSSVTEGAAMYRTLTNIVEPMRAMYAEHAADAREKENAEREADLSRRLADLQALEARINALPVTSKGNVSLDDVRKAINTTVLEAQR